MTKNKSIAAGLRCASCSALFPSIDASVRGEFDLRQNKDGVWSFSSSSHDYVITLWCAACETHTDLDEYPDQIAQAIRAEVP